MTNEKRLIDANDAVKVLCGHCGCDERECEKIGFCAEYMDIKRIPTVDAVEVVHAHWEDGCAMHNGKEVYKSIDCSHCEEVFKIESETREYWKARFKVCPFCGAIMDVGNDDGG